MVQTSSKIRRSLCKLGDKNLLIETTRIKKKGEKGER